MKHCTILLILLLLILYNPYTCIKVNALSIALRDSRVIPLCQPPAAYTGKQFGVEYLYSQSGESFSAKEEDFDNIPDDEGFSEDVQNLPIASEIAAVVPPEESDDDEPEDDEPEVFLLISLYYFF